MAVLTAPGHCSAGFGQLNCIPHRCLGGGHLLCSSSISDHNRYSYVLSHQPYHTGIHTRSPFLDNQPSDSSWFAFPTTPVLLVLAVRAFGENSTLHGDVHFWRVQGWQVSWEKHMLCEHWEPECWKGERSLVNLNISSRQTSCHIQLEAVASHSAYTTCGRGAERAELAAG